MRLLLLPIQPDEKTIARSDEWLKAHEGWRIRQTDAWPGWWEATRNESRMARYYDLADLIDRLEASF
jgi:hypothetical protein